MSAATQDSKKKEQERRYFVASEMRTSLMLLFRGIRMIFKLPYKEQKNTEIIDVSNDNQWWVESEYEGMFQKGARDKSALRCVSSDYDFLTLHGASPTSADHRYLYKLSNGRYPEQFWVEIIAYRLGCLMGVPVPPAFVAIDSGDANCGALIEWFYTNDQQYRDGGHYMQKFISDFDVKQGEQHNWETMEDVKNDLGTDFVGHWYAEWARIFIFDALIGNTDRHQENWGLIVTYEQTGTGLKYSLAPAFDNGTAMGHELVAKHFAGAGKYTNDRHLIKHYILKGCQHMKWEQTGPMLTFFEFIKRFITRYPTQTDTMQDLLDFSFTDVEEMIMQLCGIEISVRLSEERARFMLRLLRLRRDLLTDMLETGNIS